MFFKSKSHLSRNKVDPEFFSAFEPGWWALHAALITSVYLLGGYVAKGVDEH